MSRTVVVRRAGKRLGHPNRSRAWHSWSLRDHFSPAGCRRLPRFYPFPGLPTFLNLWECQAPLVVRATVGSKSRRRTLGMECVWPPHYCGFTLLPRPGTSHWLCNAPDFSLTGEARPSTSGTPILPKPRILAHFRRRDDHVSELKRGGVLVLRLEDPLTHPASANAV